MACSAYGFEGNNTILGQIYPASLRTDNYGNADYDIRHLFNADFVFNPEFHATGGLKYLINGWQFSGKAFWRTGLPYTISRRQSWRNSVYQRWGLDSGHDHRQCAARRLRQVGNASFDG